MARKSGKKRKELRAGTPAVPSAAAPAPLEGVRRAPWLWIASLVLIIAGYFLLHKVDPGGRNAWSVVSPALLLAGYLLVIPAILLSYRR